MSNSFTYDSNTSREPFIHKRKATYHKTLPNDQNQNTSFHKERKNTYTIRPSRSRKNLTNLYQTKDYIYPTTLFKELFFSWTTHLLKTANRSQLKPLHLGKFRDDYTANTFLKQILPHWEKAQKDKMNNPLIWSLLKANYFSLIIIVLLPIVVSFLNISRMILFRQVLLHFQDNNDNNNNINNNINSGSSSSGGVPERPMWSLLNTSLLMISAKFVEILLFRFFEFYTAKIGAKTTIQVNTLLYNKLLKISSFAQYNEGELINFIQIDAEKFADFFSYTPGTLVLPFQLAFYIYLLFQYFGPSFLVGMFVMTLIFILSLSLETYRLKYQKDILKLKDNRLKTTTQLFDTIKVVKLYSWEDYYLNKIRKEREDELTALKKIQLNTMILNCIFWSTGPIVSLVNILVFTLFDTPMELSNILTSIYIFNCLADPLFLFPEYITGMFDSFVSLRRIETFLNAKEFNPLQIDRSGNNSDTNYAIKINKYDFGIITKKEYMGKLTTKNNHSNNNSNNLLSVVQLLKQISLQVEYGDLLGIVGDVGSGKTCLLNAILNNLDILNNINNTKQVILNGSVAYVPQTPWILNDTVQNNILFFQEMDEDKYNFIVDICALKPDFQLLAAGDLTKIGDKGVNLSGGQKARIAIARALYSDADIYLFDDPLSALDAYVGMNIFNRVIKEYLKGKTVLLVTHALQYIPFMTHVCHLNNGEIDWFGTGEDAVTQEFYNKFCKTPLTEDEKETKANAHEQASDALKELCDTEIETKHLLTRKIDTDKALTKQKKRSIHKLTKPEYEEKIKNESRITIYSRVFYYTGGLYFLLMVFLLNIFWKACEFGSDYILTIWSLEHGLTKTQTRIFLIIYSIVSLLGIVFIFSRTVVIVNGIISYNRKMHNKLLVKLMKAPINLFHDLVPRGQIMNRLSKDLDNSLKFFWAFNSTIRLFFQLLSCILICICFNMYSLLLFPVIVFAQFSIAKFYLSGGKELNRLEATVRSPILSGFSETMNGVTSIRGYEFEEKFREKYHSKLDNFYKVLVYQNGCSNWFALNLDLVSFTLLFFVLSFAVLFENKIEPEAIGLLLSYTLKLIDHTYFFFEQLTLLERFLTSVERCETYTHVIQEKGFKQKKDETLRLQEFPHKGKLTFMNYSVRYRPNTKIVLKNLNFEIQPSEKIGVVGRTGSGKSTLCLCTFRLLEPLTGKILIDGVDITTIGLKFLREILTVIPQDPILIEGTLRDNLDPLHKFSDQQILNELNEIGLNYLIEYHGLDFPVSEGGENLSVGERQLICITRAILRRSKIVIMDEATSSIDYKTEMLIQNSINLSLKYSTVITIAHRIKTIINYDRIFVLSEGELVECGAPSALIKNGKGIFYELYRQSNL